MWHETKQMFLLVSFLFSFPSPSIFWDLHTCCTHRSVSSPGLYYWLSYSKTKKSFNIDRAYLMECLPEKLEPNLEPKGFSMLQTKSVSDSWTVSDSPLAPRQCWKWGWLHPTSFVPFQKLTIRQARPQHKSCANTMNAYQEYCPKVCTINPHLNNHSISSFSVVAAFFLLPS